MEKCFLRMKRSLALITVTYKSLNFVIKNTKQECRFAILPLILHNKNVKNLKGKFSA